MTATLERVDIFSTAFLVIDVNDYLEVRRSEWTDVERSGAVVARDGKVYISPDLVEILSTVASKYPSKYAVDGRRK
jgi:chromate transporter